VPESAGQMSIHAILGWAILGLLVSAVLSGVSAWLLWRLEKAGDEMLEWLDQENRP
jgi:hypothetical protein